jgi:RHS repeat-associated protein
LELGPDEATIASVVQKQFNRGPKNSPARRGQSCGKGSKFSTVGLRKTSHYRLHPHPPRNCALPTRSRTCFEGPFGEVIRATGPMAKANPFRFSTKYQDDETDLLYYGYRYYNASTGRWITRDPLEETGGANIYSLVNGDPISKTDVLGDFPSGTNPHQDRITVLGATWVFEAVRVGVPKGRGRYTGKTLWHPYAELKLFVTSKGCDCGGGQLRSMDTYNKFKYWYLDDSYKEGELGHVQVLRENWEILGGNVDDLGGCVPCKCARARKLLAEAYWGLYSKKAEVELLRRDVFLFGIIDEKPDYDREKTSSCRLAHTQKTYRSWLSISAQRLSMKEMIGGSANESLVLWKVFAFFLLCGRLFWVHKPHAQVRGMGLRS